VSGVRVEHPQCLMDDELIRRSSWYEHTIQSIVVANDFSDEARDAAERAAMVAMTQHAQLSLLHVIDRSALTTLGRLSTAPSELETKLIDDPKVRSMTGSQSSAERFPFRPSSGLKPAVCSMRSSQRPKRPTCWPWACTGRTFCAV